MSNPNMENDKTSETEILKLGSQGDPVKELQEYLAVIDYFKLEDNEEYEQGYFGSETETAVKQFQNDKNLEVTGILDQPTTEGLARAKLSRKKDYGDFDRGTDQPGNSTSNSPPNSETMKPKKPKKSSDSQDVSPTEENAKE